LCPVPHGLNGQFEVRAGRVMANLTFDAKKRTILGKSVSRLRRDGQIPGIVYGPVVAETVPVSVDQREFLKFYQANGHSTLFELTWEDGKHSVFIREVQLDPVRRNPLHIDFFAPNLRRPVRAMVPLVLHNPVHTSEGILTEARTEIEVEALPARMPHQIDVDISGIEHPGDAIRVGDLTIPAGLTVVTDADELVAQMEAIYQAPEEEEEVEAVAEAEEAAATEAAQSEAESEEAEE
jgi:large subunit ribosomal protein L25